MMDWPLVYWASILRKPTAQEAITAFLLLLPFLTSLLYRVYARIRRRGRRSVGLQILSDAANNDRVKYEIIAVHGLGASPEHTWTCKSNSKSKTGDNQAPVHFLKDLLMKDERFSDARILHFAYNSDWLVDACFESARDIGCRLIESLVEHRKNHPRLPLIFVGHSFGGIVIKEALSRDLNDSERILEDTSGVIFLGTPHLGSPVAGFGATIAYLTGFLGSNTGLLLLLRSNGELLVNLSKAFQACVSKKYHDLNKGTKIVSICEQKPTYLLNWLYAGKIVPWESATFGANFADVYEVDKDHSGLNKALDSADPLYKELTSQLHSIRPTSPPKINKLQQAVIDRLAPVIASDAEFHPGVDEDGRGRLECLPQTRQEIIGEICDWLNEPSSSLKHLYWLEGKAGTGKSTIARTIVGKMAKDNRIVANFFFKRGEGDRARLKRFFTTVTVQLVRKLPGLAKAVQDALESEPSLTEQDPRIQFKKLIQEPLQEQKFNDSKAIVVVVDALDECDSKEDLKTLVQQLMQPILSDQAPSSSGQFLVKYFLTSRLDDHTRTDFNKVSEELCEKKGLEKATSDTTRQDIESYLQFQLGKIDGLLDPLPEGKQWSNPSDMKNLKELTKRAYPLFEFAAAACRFISQTTIPGGPRVLLHDILQSTVYGDLDGIYLPILNRRFFNLKGQYHDRAMAQFQDVIGSVISLADSVTVACLAQLLGQPERDIRDELRLFESVLVVPTEQDSQSFVRLFHESFRDFLAGSEANEEFRIDSEKIHSHLAARCLELLNTALKENICELKSPGTHRSEVAEEVIQTLLPPEIQYTCRFWIFHVQRSKLKIRDDDVWHLFLSSHLLHWLEALSLLGRTSESASLVKELKTITHPTEGVQVRAFLEDAERLILSFRHIIDAAPLQLYSSVLSFAPTKSLVRETFDRHRAKWISRTPNVDSQWSPCLQTLEGHVTRVTCVAVSSDGILASGDDGGTVRIWDPISGASLQTFSIADSGPDGVNSLAFSGGGKLACRTRSVIVVWDIHQDICLQKLNYKQHNKMWNGSSTDSVVFTDEQKLLLAGGQLHKILTLELGHGCEEQSNPSFDGTRMVLSPDGQWVASEIEREVRIFNMGSRAGDSSKVLKVATYSSWSRWKACFSRDNQYFASVQDDERAEIWDVSSTTSLQVFNESENITALAFPQDNRFLAMGYERGKIIIWDWKKRTPFQTFPGHRRWISSFAFSPNGAWLASASWDGTVKIWDATIYDLEEENTASFFTKQIEMAMEGQRLAVLSLLEHKPLLLEDFGSKCIALPFDKEYEQLAISANGSILAAVLKGLGGVEIWDVESGNYLPVHNRHSSSICSIALSANGERSIVGLATWGVEVWESRTGRLLKQWQDKQPFEDVTRTAISLDGERIAWSSYHTGSFDAFIYIENVRASALQTIQCEIYHTLAFSQDGKRLAAVRWSWEGAIWDAATGVCLRNFSRWELPDQTWYLNPSFLDFDFIMAVDLPEERAVLDCLSKYYISPDGDWIMRHGEKLLWILPEYRPTDATVSGSNIAIGRASGRPIVIGLSDEGL